MPQYAPNPFASGAAPATPVAPAGGSPLAGQAAQSQALRTYAPNKFGGAGAPRTGAMAPHLSQAPTLDADYLEAYRSLKSDPNVPTNQRMDIDRIWRATPNSSIFKEGFKHNPYIEIQVNALRKAREPAHDPRAVYQDEDSGMRYTRDEEGNRHIYTGEGGGD